MNKLEYKEYLNSEHWIEFSRRIRKEHPVCKDCGNELNLQVHHLTYRRINKELDEDVVVLCRGCHIIRHFKAKKIRRERRKLVPRKPKFGKRWKEKLEKQKRIQEEETRINVSKIRATK